MIGSPRELAERREELRRVPGGVALIGPHELRSTRQANLADVLRFTPGIWTQSRFGAADEAQLSIRGTALRNNFHLRGVNVLVNNMPAFRAMVDARSRRQRYSARVSAPPAIR